MRACVGWRRAPGKATGGHTSETVHSDNGTGWNSTLHTSAADGRETSRPVCKIDISPVLRALGSVAKPAYEDMDGDFLALGAREPAPGGQRRRPPAAGNQQQQRHTGRRHSTGGGGGGGAGLKGGDRQQRHSSSRDAKRGGAGADRRRASLGTLLGGGADLGLTGPPPWRGFGPGGSNSSSFGSSASASHAPLPAGAPLLRLHEEVLEFVGLMSPTPAEMETADAALERVRDAARVVFPDARLEVFGSRANGLVLPTSDWDVVLFGVAGSARNMHRLAGEFTARGLASSLEVIDSARVPIVKLREAASGIAIDISFDASSGLVTRGLITELLGRYPAVRPLVLVLKYFLLQRRLNETYSGGVGSFLLVLMAAHVVQQKGREADAAAAAASAAAALGASARAGGGKGKGGGKGAADSAAAAAAAAAASDVCTSYMNLGSLLMSFFELYGFNLNYVTTGISLRGCAATTTASSSSSGSSSAASSSSSSSSAAVSTTTPPPVGGGGAYYSKARRGWLDGNRPHLLSLESPVDAAVDVGKNSWAIQRVRKAFAHAHTQGARQVRAWNEYNDALEAARGSGSGGVGKKRGRDSEAAAASSSSSGPGGVPPKPAPSILAAMLRPDELLRARARELAEARRKTARGGGDDDSDDSDDDGSSTSSSAGSSGDDEGGDDDDASSHGDIGSDEGGRSRKRQRRESCAGGDAAVRADAAAAAAVAPAAAPVEDAAAAAAAAAGPADEEAAVAAARAAALSLLAGAGVKLRHPGRLADIMTRRERRVEEKANAAALEGRWY